MTNDYFDKRNVKNAIWLKIFEDLFVNRILNVVSLHRRNETKSYGLTGA